MSDPVEGDAPKMGRPSKYDPAFCQQVEDLMAEGNSLTAAAAQIGICRETAYNWCDVHEDFFHAVKRGRARCTLWWESRLRNIAMKGGGPGTATATIFALKNIAPDDWREKSAVDHTSSDKSMTPQIITRRVVDPQGDGED